MNGIIGITVPRNITAVRICFWYGMYCFFTIPEIHRLSANAKAPIRTPTTTEETPSEAAKMANAPAPAVQSGQCADATFGTNADIRVKIDNGIRYFFID